MAMLSVFLTVACQAAPPKFETVAPGVEYRQVRWEKPRPLVMAQLRCDPKKVRFALLLASDRKGKSPVARAEEMRTDMKQLAVINCSYFDQRQRILGYHERMGQILQNQVAEDGVFGGFFYWDGRRAGLKSRREARPQGVPVLFQAGPRLVWEGRPIEGLETVALAARSGVSVDKQGRVSLFVLGLTSMTTLAELPDLLRAPVDRGGLASWRALNFDGGSSTQFSLASSKRTVNVPGLSPVPAFLGVSVP
jgi:uncharacterized protein YigE (DUF2233 family)